MTPSSRKVALSLGVRGAVPRAVCSELREDVESALAQVRAAAGDGDVSIEGGARPLVMSSRGTAFTRTAPADLTPPDSLLARLSTTDRTEYIDRHGFGRAQLKPGWWLTRASPSIWRVWRPEALCDLFAVSLVEVDEQHPQLR